jgi:simple sugar transport system permease protein
MIFGNWRPGGLLAGAALFGFMDSMQSQVDATAHALLVVAGLVFAIAAIYTASKRRWIPTGVLVAVAAGSFWWYSATDELPRELIPYFPHITTLLVLVFASQRLRMPAADGQVWRRGGG